MALKSADSRRRQTSSRVDNRQRTGASRQRQRSKTERRRESAGCYDYTLLFLTVFLSCFGLVMIYSSSSYIAVISKGSADYFLKRQGLAVILGTIAMIFVSVAFDYRILKKVFYPFKRNLWPFLPIRGWNMIGIFYFFAVLLQLYTLFFGVSINEARRWISLGPLGTIQPAEITKIAVILMVANLISNAPERLDRMRYFILLFICVMPAILFVVIENASSAIVIAAIFFIMAFVASRKIRYFIGMGVLGITGIVLYIGKSWRSGRVDIWRNVETHEKGFQILQGLYAIASGGLFGTGIGQSMQKLGFVPEAYNDMIFTVICEELGLVGAVAVILLFLLLVFRIFHIALNTKDLFGAMVCTGVMTHISLQVIVNVLVVTNTIPSTGIPLPFISYGGSSVIFLLVEMGIVLNISKQMGPSHMAALERRHREVQRRYDKYMEAQERYSEEQDQYDRYGR